ncbi:MAG: hypothetical protein SCH70_03960 [Candidatus Methanoperedens sp.]|nr:hypothetical protein [Candidatus Methanoperedens sp.]
MWLEEWMIKILEKEMGKTDMEKVKEQFEFAKESIRVCMVLPG